MLVADFPQALFGFQKEDQPRERKNKRRAKFVDRFFKLKQNGTTVGREVIAGLTTFFAMAYIIAVNPTLLSASGMEWGAVFLATIISAIIGTLIMGLVANVPYAQAPGMGLNAFFVYTVCFTLGFTWQQALSMVFICGLINILITVTKVRKYIIKSIPRSLQNAIGGGIGIFVAYIGLLNIDIIGFTGAAISEDGVSINTSGIVPELARLDSPSLWLFLIGLALTIILLVCKVKGADRHRRNGSDRHSDGSDGYDGYHQLCGSMQTAPLDLRRYFYQRGAGFTVLRHFQTSACTGHHFLIQCFRYV